MPKILVADDNTNIQKMVTLSFEDRGFQVVAVGNGEAAVRRMPDVNPDLVLADIFMPVRNGYEVCEFVKKDERFSHVPVILLIGAFDPLDEKEARRVGADGVLKKPFVPPDPLIAMVTSALEKNPKLAAELAHAKEQKAAPPPPEVVHIPEPSTSAHSEVKPLPEFPEPTTPEEQALVYGFGTSRRAIDDAPVGTADEPQAPAAEADPEAEADFDSSATSRDWRRNAMDFDVPADVANQPAFAQDSGLDASMFPSERDVPPRQVRLPETADESQPSRQNQAAVQTEAKPAIEPPADEQESEFFASSDSPATGQSGYESAPAEEDESATDQLPQPEPVMNKVAEAPSAHTPSDWMAVLSKQAAPPAPLAPLETAGTQPDLLSRSKTPAPVISAPEPQDASDDSFFADEPASAEARASSHPSAAVVEEPAEAVIEATAAAPLPISHSSSESGLEVEADSAPPVALRDPDLFEPPAVRAAPEPLMLEDDAPPEPSHYGSMAQELQPLHSFLTEIPETPAVDEPAEHEITASAEPGPGDVNERIPTVPLTREAMSEIPFLTPPPELLKPASEPSAANSDTVNAVVQKVLEKLEPQLHDLLSQGVLRPLVENLLQKEAAKKVK